MTRPTRLLLVLFALLLPLQGFASFAACGDGGTPGTAAHCAEHAPAAPAGGMHHHDCGACCGVAVSATPALRLPGRVFSGGALPPPFATVHPTLLLDRLDRPPRR